MTAAPEYLRIGELAERAGVSVATIKYYIREGILPPPPIKTGRTMGYYDQAYLDRVKTIRVLREEHFLPLRVIRAVLEQRGDAPLAPGEAALLASVAPGVMRRLEAEPEGPITRAALIERFKISGEELELMEEMGLIGDRGEYHRTDEELLEALERAEAAGLTRQRFPVEQLGHYVELIGELARREIRIFTHQAETIPAAEVATLAERAVEASEPVVAVIRRKLILRALRAELDRTTATQKKETP